jgi:protein-S-isoprenylcysteine O-methyltransferase Ste14
MQPAKPVLVRAGYLLYAAVAYVTFLVTIVYAIGFVGNFWPYLGASGELFRGLDVGGPPSSSAGEAWLIDALLLGVFALQHSGMARVKFKAAWTRIVPEALERSTYVLTASLCLLLLFWQWRPLGTTVIWQVASGPAVALLVALSLVGWALVFAATFMLDHYELFGLRQVWDAFRSQTNSGGSFRTPGLYKSVRHPIYLGFVIAFWATPLMPLGHLVFAAATTGYILFAIQLEERDLIQRYGDVYRQYRQRAGMLLPLLRPARSDSAASRPTLP